MKVNKLFLFGALLFGLTACSSDDTVSDSIPESKAELTFLSGDQSRILSPRQSAGSRAAAAVVDPEAPAIPAGAIEFDKEALNNWNDGVLLAKGSTYMITKPYTGSVSTNDMNGSEGEAINIYVAADAEFTTWWDDWRAMKANIYVLPGATLKWDQAGNDYMAKLPDGVKVYVWGDLTTPDNMGLRLYQGGAELYVYNTNGDNEFIVKTAVNPYYNDPKTQISFQVDEGCVFYSSRAVRIEGNAQFEGGSTHFANNATIEGNCYPEFQSEVTFDRCSYIMGQLDNKAADGAVFNVNEYLYTGSLHGDGKDFTINLKEALLDIDHVFDTVTPEYAENRLVDKGAGKTVINGLNGEYYSVARVLDGGVMYIDRGNDYETSTVGEWPNQTSSISKYKLTNFTGYVNIAGTLENKLYYEPAEGIDFSTLDDSNLDIADDKVHFNDGDVYLPATDCRPAIGDGVIIVGPEVAHKYSATSIDFGTDGTLYLCWHSNVNTNKEDGEEYGPSVAGTSDWGGIVDVINVNTYDPSKSIFEQTMMQNEFKYNHVKYFGGKLYLASTSSKVGAALHELQLSGSKIDEAAASVRVNLTGTSANSVDVLGDKLLTISGFNNGGLNYFGLTDYSNQEKKAINAASTEYQGKYIFVDKKANKVIALNSTVYGTVTIYNASTMAVENTFNVGAINPKDGKNVCISDGQKIYICRGQNGFDIYDFNGNKVGGSKKHANGCDVDDNYIYVATGDGLAVLSKTKQDAAGNNKTIKVVKFTGKGFVYPGVRGGKMDDSVKQSSNFVKVYNGNVYVAHGMYGLRIYKLADLVG